MNVFTLPNLLSLSRLPILPLIYLSLKSKRNDMVIILLSVAVITDILDGFIARKRGEETVLGRILDHVIDKIFFNSFSLFLYFFRGLPLYFVLFLFIRDFLSLVFAFVLWKKGKLMGANFAGRLAGLTVSLMFVSYLFELKFKHIFLYLSIVFISLASIAYLINYLRTLKEISSYIKVRE